ncbi:MAG: ATP-binding cassette domain-containing protein, partial [Planctomycetota bacterium]
MSTITVDKSPPRTPPPVSSVDATPPRTDAPPALQLCNASRGYGSGGSRVEVLRNLNLSVRKGEFVAVVGFSGSGKTTLMQLMAGLLGPDSGETLMNGEPYNQPESRRGLVFQNYSLLPWLTVYGNIELAVRQVFKHWDRATRDAHIRKFIDMVSLTPAMRKRPGELS